MKKLFLLAVVIAGLWQIKIPEKASVNNLKQAKPDMPKMPIQIEDVTFICDGREYCSTITSAALLPHMKKPFFLAKIVLKPSWTGINIECCVHVNLQNKYMQ
jgi:hypothetical protein